MGVVDRKPRTPLTERLCAQLEDDIVTGRLPPGERLDEVRLAERFNVSRTPVREALQRLSQTDLVIRRPHRGVEVGHITAADVTQLFEAMAEMEALCGRYAARRMSAAQRHSLERLHVTLGETVRRSAVEAYEQANRCFHEMIYDGAHNRALVDLAHAARRRAAPFRRVQFNTLGRLAHSYAEHQRIVDALMRADEDRTAQALFEHILASRNSARDYMTSL